MFDNSNSDNMTTGILAMMWMILEHSWSMTRVIVVLLSEIGPEVELRKFNRTPRQHAASYC